MKKDDKLSEVFSNQEELRLGCVRIPDGSFYWYKGKNLHREDGPAIERADGNNAWFINGKRLTEEEFLKAKTPIVKSKNYLH